ncbi:hypothetical protein BS47DRAFT_1343839 [Hydnum rufescens UP504]|uniref:Kelch repeat-containing protein n=1 Tax=Hydnum rufescens UP504 TaxID=1448309 RepID=A0A9P6DU28_9AGAM|nr:hypothetical protein BS47DRAFT_1343839 [Hydnum rufescens UP504]
MPTKGMRESSTANPSILSGSRLSYPSFTPVGDQLYVWGAHRQTRDFLILDLKSLEWRQNASVRDPREVK